MRSQSYSIPTIACWSQIPFGCQKQALSWSSLPDPNDGEPGYDAYINKCRASLIANLLTDSQGIAVPSAVLS